MTIFFSQLLFFFFSLNHSFDIKCEKGRSAHAMFSKAYYTYSLPTFNTFLRYPNNIGFETSRNFISIDGKKKRAHNVWIRVVTLHNGSFKKLNNGFRPLTKVSKKIIESNLMLNPGKEPGQRNCPKLLVLWERV